SALSALLQVAYDRFIFRPPGGIDDAEKEQFAGPRVLDVLDRAGAHVHDFLGRDRRDRVVHMHPSLAADEVIDLRCLQSVWERRRALLEFGVRHAIPDVCGIPGRMKQLAENGAISREDLLA